MGPPVMLPWWGELAYCSWVDTRAQTRGPAASWAEAGPERRGARGSALPRPGSLPRLRRWRWK